MTSEVSSEYVRLLMRAITSSRSGVNRDEACFEGASSFGPTFACLPRTAVREGLSAGSEDVEKRLDLDLYDAPSDYRRTALVTQVRITCTAVDQSVV